MKVMHKADCETVCRPLGDDSNCDCGATQLLSPERWLARRGYSDSRPHSAPAIAALIEEYISWKENIIRLIESSQEKQEIYQRFKMDNTDGAIIAEDMHGEPLRAGDQIEFTYKGSIEDAFNKRQLGRIEIETRPVIRWAGGSCPLEDYTEDVVKQEWAEA